MEIGPLKKLQIYSIDELIHWSKRELEECAKPGCARGLTNKQFANMVGIKQAIIGWLEYIREEELTDGKIC